MAVPSALAISAAAAVLLLSEKSPVVPPPLFLSSLLTTPPSPVCHFVTFLFVNLNNPTMEYSNAPSLLQDFSGASFWSSSDSSTLLSSFPSSAGQPNDLTSPLLDPSKVKPEPTNTPAFIPLPLLDRSPAALRLAGDRGSQPLTPALLNTFSLPMRAAKPLMIRPPPPAAFLDSMAPSPHLNVFGPLKTGSSVESGEVKSARLSPTTRWYSGLNAFGTREPVSITVTRLTRRG